MTVPPKSSADSGCYYIQPPRPSDGQTLITSPSAPPSLTTTPSTHISRSLMSRRHTQTYKHISLHSPCQLTPSRQRVSGLKFDNKSNYIWVIWTGNTTQRPHPPSSPLLSPPASSHTTPIILSSLHLFISLSLSLTSQTLVHSRVWKNGFSERINT